MKTTLLDRHQGHPMQCRLDEVQLADDRAEARRLQDFLPPLGDHRGSMPGPDARRCHDGRPGNELDELLDSILEAVLPAHRVREATAEVDVLRRVPLHVLLAVHGRVRPDQVLDFGEIVCRLREHQDGNPAPHASAGHCSDATTKAKHCQANKMFEAQMATDCMIDVGRP